MTKRFEEEWNAMSTEEKNVLVVNHIKSLSRICKFDLKKIICCVFDVDYMDDKNLREKVEEIIYER